MLSLLNGLGYNNVSKIFTNLAGIDIPFISELEWTIQVRRNFDSSKNPKDFWDSFKEDARKGIDSTINKVGQFVNSDLTKNVVYESNNKEWVDIASFESFISLNGNSDSQIVENAVENGSFRSVNKINRPRTFVVELAQGGSRDKIENMLSNLRKYQGSELFVKTAKKSIYRGDVLCRLITPYGVIESLNLKSMSYSFEQDSGSNLLVVKLTFQEIKQSLRVTDFSVDIVKDPSTSDTSNTGKKAMGSAK